MLLYKVETFLITFSQLMKFFILKEKDKKKESLKINMCKAYDKINQNFLRTILLSMNFSHTWVNWIMEYVTVV